MTDIFSLYPLFVILIALIPFVMKFDDVNGDRFNKIVLIPMIVLEVGILVGGFVWFVILT